MKNPIRRASLALALFVGLAPGGAVCAQDFIWFQPPNTNSFGIIAQEIEGPQSVISTYLVSDVVINDPSGGIILDSVSSYFTSSGAGWNNSSIESGRLLIFPKNDVQPSNANDNPTDGLMVDVDLFFATGLIEIRAELLNIPLDNGSYWISLVPITPADLQGQEFHFPAGNDIGDPSWSRNPSGFFGLGSDWIPSMMLDGSFTDAAIRVTGFSMRPGNTFEPPAAAETFRGVALAGGLAEMQESDDLRALFNPGFTLNNTEAPVWLIFDANVGNTTDFNFLVESQAGTPGLTYTCEAWNYNTNMFDVIGSEPDSFNTDTVETYTLVASDHFDGSGNVRSRVGWRQTGFTLNFPWEVRVDVVGWDPTQ